MKAVPIIDIEPFDRGTEQERLAVARSVGQACEEIGFLVLAGHGISSASLDEMYAISRLFFDLPLDRKMRYCPPEGVFRGYKPVASSALSKSLDLKSPPDLKESFTVGPTHTSDDDYYSRPEGRQFFADTPWPTKPKRLRAVWTSYYGAMENLASRLMRIFATALDLREDFFNDKIDRHISSLGVINYPPHLKSPVPGQVRAGAHTDYGSLTILYKDEGSGGLQVRNQAGEWIDVEPVPGTFIVNIGDLMAQWTNDRWTSTMHRVVNPAPEVATTSRRISIVFFHQPNYDAVITPVDSCITAENPSMYAPVTSGEHLLMKIRKAANA